MSENVPVAEIEPSEPTETTEPSTEGQEQEATESAPETETIPTEEAQLEVDQSLQKVRTEFECRTMSLEAQQKIAIDNGWHRLGEKYVTFDMEIDDDDKIRIGQEMADAVSKADDLEAKKKAFDSSISDQIKDLYGEISGLAQRMNQGKSSEERLLPCFLDPVLNERVYVNPNTKEFVHREDAQASDKQINLFQLDERGIPVLPMEADAAPIGENEVTVDPAIGVSESVEQTFQVTDDGVIAV